MGIANNRNVDRIKGLSFYPDPNTIVFPIELVTFCKILDELASRGHKIRFANEKYETKPAPKIRGEHKGAGNEVGTMKDECLEMNYSIKPK